jgi:serine/threonine-protein kinase
LRSLLRRRLRFLCPMLAVVYAVGVTTFLMSWGIPLTALAWNLYVSFAITLLLCGVLLSRWPLSLAQLRAVELVLLVILAIRIVFRGYVALWSDNTLRHFQLWRDTGDGSYLHSQLSHSALFLCYPAAFYILAYGVCIPNTWRRCLVVVACLWIIGPIMWVIGIIDNELPWWSHPGVLTNFALLTAAAALAVYGSHRVESLRRAEVQARRLGQYALKRRLGGGGMGEVFLADHLLLRRPCAIKLIRPERAGDPAMLQRFEREVRATATLTHPNAVQIFDYGRTSDGTFYYVMEYLPGLTLEELVKSHGPLPAARVVHLLQQLCGALAEAHEIGLIHRDIKPGNVMLCKRGGVHDVAKLLDFGLVQSHFAGDADDRLTQEGTVIGTPAFLSPEQAGGGDQVDARSDIYSLGCLAYFLLAGQPPFAGRSQVKMLAAHLYEAPAPLTSDRPDVPRDLEAVTLQCLAKNPGDRFADARTLALALAQCKMAVVWTEEDAAAWWQAREAALPVEAATK